MMSMFCLAVISKSGSYFSTSVVLTYNNSKNENISNIRLLNENIFFSGRSFFFNIAKESSRYDIVRFNLHLRE